MSAKQQHLEAGIHALEAQRALLGDAVVDAMLEAAHSKLAALRAAAEPAQALKQVSILFLDVVGSTMLTQQLDPEAISAVMDDALARSTAIVEAHRGKVLQYAGDSILAAFGVDEAREDDAERAVHCGLALLELGKTLGLEVQVAHGHAGFNIRVGLHTGGVLLGGGVDAEGSIRGIAVNIAARMEQTAPAGALRISNDTYAQVRGLFEVETQEPLTIKGVDTPVQSYLVRRAKPRQFRIATRGIEGVATKMIGRDTELDALKASFKRLFTERKLQSVTVVAEAGIGKSRLLNEFEGWAEARPETFCLFRCRATPQTGTQAFCLLRDIIAWRFQINDDDSVAAARKKMEEGILPLFLHDDGADLAEGHAHLLGHLIGIEWNDSRHIRGILEDPKQIRNRAFHAAAQLFRRLSASDGSPVILQLEDLHWADGGSLEFLNYLSEVNRDVPLLVLSSTRPTLFERRTDWSSTEGIHQRIDLQPLGKDMSQLLANELLKQLPEIPAALRELLTSSAEGNPFYMEELVTMLIEKDVIRTGDIWGVNTEKLVVTQVPLTLTGVLQARLDMLPAAEKRALQQASVVGAVFWDKALAAVDEQAAEQLPALVQRELTLPRADAQLEGLREYAFRNQLLHQVTYETVLKRQKRVGHARVAQWFAGLTEQGSLRAGDFLGLAAEHFELAGDEASAAEFHTRAAERAGQRFGHDHVLAHVDRALVLMGQGDRADHLASAEQRWRLLSAREVTLHLQGRRNDQAADLEALAQLADKLDDNRLRADAAYRKCRRAMRLADWAAMESSAHYGMACATLAEDTRRRLQALSFVAFGRVQRGQPEAGRKMSLQHLAEARNLTLGEVEGRLLTTLSTAAFMQGDLLGALELNRQGLQAFRESGDRIGEAISLANYGDGWLKLGELEQARRELNAALHLLRANGDRAIEAATLGQLSTLRLWQGDDTAALSLARSALDLAVAARAPDVEVNAGLKLGDAEVALGRLGAARQAYTQARTRAKEIGSPWQLDASAGVARVALAEGDAQGSVAALQPILEHVESGGTLDGTEYPRLVQLTCHQTLGRASDPRATHWLASAHTALMVQADAITDAAVRRSFLQDIPWHREIVMAWAMCNASSQAPAEPTG